MERGVLEARRDDRDPDAERPCVTLEPTGRGLADARELGRRTPPSPAGGAGRDGTDDRGHERVDQGGDGGRVAGGAAAAAPLRPAKGGAELRLRSRDAMQ